MNSMKFTCNNRTISGKSYVPPVLSNGSLTTQIDFRGEQRQYAYFKMIPGIYRAGRRYNDRRGQLFPHGFFQTRRDPARLTGWSETLDCGNAAVTTACRYAGNRSIDTTAFVHWKYDVLAIRKELKNVDDYELDYVFGWSVPPDLNMHGEKILPKNRMLQPTAPKGMSFRLSASGDTAVIDYELGDLRGFCGSVTLFTPTPGAQWLVDGNRFTLKAPRGAACLDLFVIPVDTMDENQDAARALARCGNSFDAFFADHQRVTKRFWSASQLDIPDQKILGMYITSNYYLRCCSTKWGIPVGVFPSHWNGTYFGFNNFVQTLCCGGHREQALKVPDFRNRMLKHAVARVSSGRFKPVGALFAWMSDENDNECTTPGFWCDHRFQLGCIAEEAWRYYEFTRDVDYLEKTGYPLIFNCAEYFRCQMVYEIADGRTIIGNCTDLERIGPARKNAYLTTCFAIGAMEWAAAAADVLQCDKEVAVEWRRIAAKLRDGLPNDGKKYLPYPDCAETSVAVLGGVYPNDVLPETDPLQLAAVNDLCDRRNEAGNMYCVGQGMCSWYAAFTAIALGRLGDRRAIEYLNLAVNNAGCFSEVFEINEPGRHVSVPWCTEPSTCYARAVQEQLMMVRGSDIFFGRVVPVEWKRWSFTLYAPDDLKVAARFVDGRLRLLLTAGKRHSGTALTLHGPGGAVCRVELKHGEKRAVEL